MKQPGHALPHVRIVVGKWVEQLTDLSRRNPLLYFRHLKKGTLDTSQGLFERLLADEQVGFPDLVSSEDWDLAQPRLKELEKIARANFEDKGLSTLSLAAGFVSWTARDGGRDPLAPLILLPVEVHGTGRDLSRRHLVRSGDPTLNTVLSAALKEDHGLRIQDRDVLPEVDDLDGHEAASLLSRTMTRMRQIAAGVPGFEVRHDLVLANFSFQKQAMVRDLEEGLEVIAEHPVVGALAGLHEARRALAEHSEPPAPGELDHRHPDEEFLVFDADSSQQTAIEAVVGGRTGVIQGPPGTGKSQTIANLLATLAAQGKRVLFVAEKRAALEVVHSRLSARGLGHLCLDLHGGTMPKREVARAFATSFDVIKTSLPPHTTDLHDAYVRRRRELNAATERLHVKRPLVGMSFYELAGKVLDLRRRLVRPSSVKLTRAAFEAINRPEFTSALIAMEPHAALVLNTCDSPWSRARLSTPEDVEQALHSVRELASMRARLEQILGALHRSTGIAAPTTPDELTVCIEMLAEARACADASSTRLLGEATDELVIALQPARYRWLARAWARAFSPAFRKAVRRAEELYGDDAPRPHPVDLFEIVKRVSDLRRAWAHRSRRNPALFDRDRELEEIAVHLKALNTRLATLVDDERHRSNAELKQIFDSASRLSEWSDHAKLVPRINAWREQLHHPELHGFAEDLEAHPSTGWPDRFESLCPSGKRA